MKKMTKWLAVCAVCVMGSVPAMAAEVPDVTVNTLFFMICCCRMICYCNTDPD